MHVHKYTACLSHVCACLSTEFKLHVCQLVSLCDFLQHGTVKDHSSDKFNVIFCMIVCSLFGLSSLSLLVFHTYLSLFNKTTLGKCYYNHALIFYCTCAYVLRVRTYRTLPLKLTSLIFSCQCLLKF